MNVEPCDISGPCEHPKCNNPITDWVSDVIGSTTWLYYVCWDHIDWAKRRLTMKERA